MVVTEPTSPVTAVCCATDIQPRLESQAAIAGVRGYIMIDAHKPGACAPRPLHHFVRRGVAALASLLMLGSVAVQAEIVFHRGNTAEPATLDPHFTTATYEAHVLHDLLEGLVIRNAEGTMVPGAAESWVISEDGTTYTFHLRSDARWSNGAPVTAADFAFSLRRILIPETDAPYANVLYPIKNAEGVNTGDAMPQTLGVEAIDDKTLRITLETATPYFLELITHQTSLPVYPPAVEAHGDEFARPGNLVSNGAYKLTEVVPMSHIRADRNDQYWDNANVQVDTVFYYPTEDRDAALRRFQAGEIHVNNDVPQDQVRWMRENMPGEFMASPRLGTFYFALDLRNEILADPRVRRALSMAIDREYLVEEVTGAGEIPAYSFVPSGTGNYGEPAFADYTDQSIADRMETATTLFAEAGLGPDNPLEIELRFNTSANNERVALAVAEMWAPLGVTVTLFNTDAASHYAHLADGGEFEVAVAGWIGDYNDPQTFLFMLESDNTRFNYAKYDNPAYDALMDQAAATIDLEARAAVLKQAEELFMRDLPFIPVYHYVNLELVSEEIEGWEQNVTGRHLTRFVRIVE